MAVDADAAGALVLVVVIPSVNHDVLLTSRLTDGAGPSPTKRTAPQRSRPGGCGAKGGGSVLADSGGTVVDGTGVRHP